MNVKQMPSPTLAEKCPKRIDISGNYKLIFKWPGMIRVKIVVSDNQTSRIQLRALSTRARTSRHNTTKQTAQRARHASGLAHAWLRASYTIVCDIQTSVDHNQTKTNRKPIENSHSGPPEGALERSLTDIRSAFSLAPLSLSYAARVSFSLHQYSARPRNRNDSIGPLRERIDRWLLFTVFQYFMMCVTWIMNIFYFVLFPNR